MTFPINTSVPFATNTPAQDQPQMLTNFSNISGFLGVDHTAPGTLHAGQHNKVTITDVFAPSSQTNPESIVYSRNGNINSTVSQLFFLNSNITGTVSSSNPGFLLNAIRSVGFFSVSLNVITPIFMLNSSVATWTSPGIYDISITNGAASGSNFAVLVSSNLLSTYTITGSGTFRIKTGSTTTSLQDAINVSFAVLQW